MKSPIFVTLEIQVLSEEYIKLYFTSHDIRPHRDCLYQPLPAITLRTQQSVQRKQRASSLFLFARVHRFTTWMSSRVRDEFRVSYQQSLREQQVCQPLSPALWIQCQLQSSESQSNLQLQARFHGRSFQCMLPCAK